MRGDRQTVLASQRAQPRSDSGSVARAFRRQARRCLRSAAAPASTRCISPRRMPWLPWQCSDRAEHLPGIRAWLDEAALPNTPAPIEARRRPWFLADRDLRCRVHRQHLAHHGMGRSRGVVSRPGREAGVRADAAASFTLAVYGPFNYGGEFTSDSNREFDVSLKARDPRMGIRDVEAVDALARTIGLQLIDDIAMPANNRCRVWRRGLLDRTGGSSVPPRAFP